MQAELDKMVQYCTENSMRINGDKTKVVLFNTGHKYDFMPQLTIDGQQNLEVVEEFRLLGVIFQSNLSWQANTDLICQKGYSRLWMLKRLKKLGANALELTDVYYKQIRCVLELAVAVWTPGLTIAQTNQIERVQKCTLHVILGENYISYDQAKCILGLDNLSDRRDKLCLNLAKKAEKHKKYSNWFHPAEIKVKPNFTTRTEENLLQTKYTPVPFRTDRYRDSPLPFLTELLNNYHSK